MKRRISYIVCATPRSGSGLLCEALGRTGFAGMPDEFFLEKVEERYSKIWGTTTFDEYLEKIVAKRSTSNEVFGLKLMPKQIRYLRSQLFLKDPEMKKVKIHHMLSSLFPNLHYIWLTRRDKVRQAVSFYKARETGAYQYMEYPPLSLKSEEFNLRKINRLVHNLSRQDKYWGIYFKTIHTSPLIVTYEDHLEQNLEVTVRHIINNYLGVKMPDSLIIWTAFRKQSDEHTEKFVNMYNNALQGEKL